LQSPCDFVKITFISDVGTKSYQLFANAPRFRRFFPSRPFFSLLFTAIAAARNVGRADRRNLNRRFRLFPKNFFETRNLAAFDALTINVPTLNNAPNARQADALRFGIPIFTFQPIRQLSQLPFITLYFNAKGYL